MDKFIELLLENPSDIVTLKAFNSLVSEKKLTPSEHIGLFRKLSGNLMKNQREVRLQSLKALSEKFEKLQNTHSNDE